MKLDKQSSPIREPRAFSAFEWAIALRYLRTRRKEGFVSVIAIFSLLGIALGVATLIIVMAVMIGFRDELVSRILGVSGHITIIPVGGNFTDYETTASDVLRIEGVTLAAPVIDGQVLATSASGNSGVLARGIRRDDLLKIEKIANPESFSGSLDKFGSPERKEGVGVAIGVGLAKKLKLSVGEKITLVSPRGLATPFGVTPRIKSYYIDYIFKIGMSEYDRLLVYMPLAEAQIYFSRHDRVDALEIRVQNPQQTASYRSDLAAIIKRPASIVDWQNTNSSLINALAVERNVMFLILTLIILVAALNIISGMVMMVDEKNSDIAVLRSFGVSSGAVMRIFFICGSSIGIVGTIAGVVLGTVFSINIEFIHQALSTLSGANLFDPEVYFLSQIPAKLHLSDILKAAGMALSLSFLATLYPAWKAARLNPAEVLRYE